jgi:O-antigen/teichoic acid export membrane protein
MQPITWGASLAVAVLVPRYLSDAALGQFGVAWSIASLIAVVASLGLQNLLTRKVATSPERSGVLASAAVALVISCGVLITALLLPVLSMFRNQSVEISLIAIAVSFAMLSTVQAVVQAVLIGLGRNAHFAISVAGTQVLTASTGLAALFAGGDAHAYIGASVGGSLIATGLLLATSGLHFSRAGLALHEMRALAVGALPFFGWSVALRIRGGVDVILTGILLQASVAGWLLAAYRIISFPVFIPTIIATPLLPALSRSRGEPAVFRRLLQESLAAVLLLTVPVSASIFALAPAIPAFLGWRESLQHAVPVITILALQQPLVATDIVLGVSLIALGLERRWFRVAVVGAIINPVLNLLAIPFTQSLTGNGAIGAAIVEVSTECVFLAGALYLTPHGLLGRDSLSRAGRTVVAGLALVVVARSLLTYGLPIAFAAGGITYVGLALILGVLRPRQFWAVRVALRAA